MPREPQPNQLAPLEALLRRPKNQMGGARPPVLHTSAEIERQANEAKEEAAAKEGAPDTDHSSSCILLGDEGHELGVG